MNQVDRLYYDLLKNVLNNDQFIANRTDIGVYSIFGATLELGLQQGLTIKTK